MKYHNYIFLRSKLHPSDLSETELKRNKKEFLKILDGKKEVEVFSYSTLGLKAGTNILLWFQSDNLEKIQDLIAKLLHSKLGKYLKISYSYFGLARETQYSPHSQDYLNTLRKGRDYLIIYPFTKTPEWYQLNFQKRKKLMGGHIDIGMKHPKVEQLLLYSFGLDDQEFIVSYETNDLLEFQSLVMELRSDKVRTFTLNDTPIFTCIYQPWEKALDYL
jgi:chlorite dismutase